MGQCKASRNNAQSSCCCKHCEHNRLDPIEGYCCRCIPRTICITFQPDNSRAAPSIWTAVHLPEEAIGTIEFYETLLIKSVILPRQEWYLTVSLRRGDDSPFTTGTATSTADEECFWLIAIDWIDYDNGIQTTEFFIFPVYDDGSGDAVGCLTADSDSLVTSYTFKPTISFDPIGYGAEIPGTLTVTKAQHVLIPARRNEDGCFDVVCINCECFPECVCIVYRIAFYIPDEDAPTQLELVGNIYRSVLACWDPDIGEAGGWYAAFEENFITSCADGLTVLFELIEDDDGTCMLVATTTGGPDPEYIQDEGLYPLGNEPGACDDIYDLWEWGSADATTGTGSIIAPSGTGTNPLILRQLTITSNPCRNGCIITCCKNLPDQLLITITQGDPSDPCFPPGTSYVELLIGRVDCHSAAYYGYFEDAIEFVCYPESIEEGFGDIEIRFTCNGCSWDYVSKSCECPCNGDEDPGSEKCHTISSVKFLNFDCYNPFDCSHSSIGVASNIFGKCGNWQSQGTFYQNHCTPIYYDSGPIATSGIDGTICCDSFSFTITEPPA